MSVSGHQMRDTSALRRWLSSILQPIAEAGRWALGLQPQAPILCPYRGHEKTRPVTRWTLTVVALAFCFVWGAAFALLAPYVVAPLLLPILALALIVIWALPDARTAPVGVMRSLLFAFFVAMVMWPNYLAVAIPGLPRITILRLIGVPITVLLLISISVSASFRASLKASLGSAKWLWIGVLTFFIVQLVSVGFSPRKSASINGIVVVTINWLVLYLVSAYVCSRKGDATRLAAILSLMSVAIVGICFWERALNQVPWVGHIPSFFVIDDPTIQRILAGTSRGGKAHRVQATFSTSLGLSEFFALATPFLLHFGFGRYSRGVRFGAIAAIPLVLAGCLLTQARTGLVGMFIAVMLFPVVKLLFYWWRNRKDFLASALVLLSPAFLVVGSITAYVVPGIRYRLLGGGAEQYSNQGRTDQWHMGMPKVWHHPWGYGIGQGAETLGYTNLAGMLTIDSYTLRLLLEYGVFGLLVFYGMFIAGVGYGARALVTLRDEDDQGEFSLFIPLAIAFIAYIVMRSVFAQEDNQSVIYAMFGMVTGLCYQLRSRTREVAPRSDLAPLSRRR